MDLALLNQKWLAQWPKALALWSPFLRLREPVICTTENERNAQGLTGSFAMIRLNDHSVVVSPALAQTYGVQDFPLEILAHEIGHHIYTPGDLNDYGRLSVRIYKALGRQNQHTANIANMYEDLLINDRLFRDKKLPMDKVFLAMERSSDSPLWNFYLRIYEILWALPTASLCTSAILTPTMEADAQISCRLIRRYANEWIDGGGRFALLCLPYLIEEAKHGSLQKSGWGDTLSAGRGTEIPQGIAALEEDEGTIIHPSEDPELTGLGETDDGEKEKDRASVPAHGESGGNGQYREPFEFGQILKAMGINMSDRDIAKKYYRERAIPSLIPFPKKSLPQSSDPLPEGLDVWDIGNSLDQINWVATATRSPVIIPGYTTMEQVWGEQPGQAPKEEPIDLDLYVDCSGSMPDPTSQTSFLTLAGTIIALSALRAGSRVQATLWSGAGEYSMTKGFVREEDPILSVLTGYFGGGTAFPIHILRDTYEKRKSSDRKVHILVISDEGVDTIYNTDEKGNDGKKISAMALEKAGGGGTFVLNLYSDWKTNQSLVYAASQGWDIQRVSTWEELVSFAQAFSKKKYSKELT